MRRFNLSEWAVHQPALVLFFILGFGIAGALAFARLGRAEDPNFTIKVADVVVPAIWPGRPRGDVRIRSRTGSRRSCRSSLTSTACRPTPSPPSRRCRSCSATTRRRRRSRSSSTNCAKKLGDLRPELPRELIGPNVNDEYGDVNSVLYMLTGEGDCRTDLHAGRSGS